MLELFKTIELKNVRFSPQPHPCFMYTLDRLGITVEGLCGAFEDHLMDIYRYRINRGIPKTVKMQNELYSMLLKKVKSNKNLYFSHAVLFSAECSYCENPCVEGRHGMCALPESARNKMRSLNVFGFSCDSFDKDWLKDPWMCGIIYEKD